MKSPEQQEVRVIESGKRVLQVESLALARTQQLLSSSFASAVQYILQCKGKVVISGLGKSGHIAQKMASTLSSTGTASFFLHPSEALHGDFGMIGPQDCLLAITFGGETREVIAVVKYAKKIKVPIIGLTGNLESSLAQLSDCVLNGSVEKEADPFDLTPTSSSTVAMALGDALAVALMEVRGFSKESFAQLHPGGSIGRYLACVSDFMHPCDQLLLLGMNSDFHTVLKSVTKHNFGLAILVDSEGLLLGCISDGDLRRALLTHGGEALKLNAKDIMCPSPKRVLPTTKALDAINLMEKHKITSLLVASQSDKFLGLIRLHDLISAKII